MPTQQGVQITYGTSTGDVSLYANVSATSETYKRQADTSEAKDALGNVISTTYTNANDELSLELYVAKVGGVIPATPIPGVAVTVTILAGGDASLAGLWILHEASVKMSNTDYAQTSLTLRRFAGITPA